MKSTLITLISLAILTITSITLASPPAPIVNKNVHVLPNATPAQCPSSLDSRQSPDTLQTDSGHGEDDSVSSPVIRSCTGCAIDSQTHDCVCATCYDYANN